MTAALPVLYSFRRCPYAMRARLALLASGQACELREVVLRDKPQALRDASSKATVPVLVLPDGQVIDESLDIMLWALRRHDPLGWLVPTEGDLSQMLFLVAGFDRDFKPLLDRAKYPQRYGLADGLAERDAALPLLQALAQRLERQLWLLGAHATLADMAVLPFVRQYAAIDDGWFRQHTGTALQRWLDVWLAGPLFEQTMARFAPWRPGTPSITFGRR